MQIPNAENHARELHAYYRSAFPFEHLWAWLNSCRHEESPRREFAFVSSNKRFTRDLRFATHHEWQTAMLAQIPMRVEVGPQWNTLCTAGTEYANLSCTPQTSQSVSSEEMSNIFSDAIRQSEWNDKLVAMQQSVGFHDIAPVYDVDAASVSTQAADVTTTASASDRALVQTTLMQGFAEQAQQAQQLKSTELHHSHIVKTIDPNIQRFPVRRELIFDIDINDYDDVRSCCQGPRACTQCWDIIWCAVLVLNAFLKKQCNLDHVLWVYSGRRGVHCWVSDQDVIANTNQQRQMMLNLMQVVPKLHQRTLIQAYQDAYYCYLHKKPWANHALHLLMPIFEKLWINSVNAERVPVFESFLDTRVRGAFRTRLQPNANSQIDKAARWQEFTQQHEQFLKSPKHMQQGGAQSVHDVVHRIVFCCLYPRFDIPVTVQMNHLLKLPFCIHPETLQVCLPFETLRRDQVMQVLRAPKLADIVDCIRHKNRFPYDFRRAVNLLHVKAALIHSCYKNQTERGKVRAALPPPVHAMHELPELAAFGDMQLQDPLF